MISAWTSSSAGRPAKARPFRAPPAAIRASVGLRQAAAVEPILPAERDGAALPLETVKLERREGSAAIAPTMRLPPRAQQLSR
jgi:hypothetical protein